MKNFVFSISTVLILNCLFLISCKQKSKEHSELNLEDTKIIKQFFDEALTTRETYELLDHLSNKIGHRLSGSEGAAKAVNWTEKVMNNYGFDKVYKQDLLVPNWKRGDKEVARIIDSKEDLSVLALGMSVPTPKDGIKAKILEVQRLEDLEILGRENIEGKIVFFNRPTTNCCKYCGSYSL